MSSMQFKNPIITVYRLYFITDLIMVDSIKLVGTFMGTFIYGVCSWSNYLSLWSPFCFLRSIHYTWSYYVGSSFVMEPMTLLQTSFPSRILKSPQGYYFSTVESIDSLTIVCLNCERKSIYKLPHSSGILNPALKKVLTLS